MKLRLPGVVDHFFDILKGLTLGQRILLPGLSALKILKHCTASRSGHGLFKLVILVVSVVHEVTGATYFYRD